MAVSDCSDARPVAWNESRETVNDAIDVDVLGDWSVVRITGVVGVLATRGTLASRRFAALHDSLKPQVRYILQPCDGLAEAIERQHTALVAMLCQDYTQTMGPFGTENGQIDTLVLGCTHYPFVEDSLQGLVGPTVRLVDTGGPVAQQLARRLAAAALGRLSPTPGSLHFMASGDLPVLQAATARWQII